jgi:hypothetical protein
MTGPAPDGARRGTGHQPGADQAPHWEPGVNEKGELTATLVGFGKPLVVSAPDLETLRKKVKETIMRGML